MIFIVNGGADLGRTLAQHLKAGGHVTRTFEDSASALREAETHPPELFLLDVDLAGSDGLELCRRLRRQPNLAGTPIIFVTASASEDERILGLEAGADDYIAQPFGPRELSARIKAVLRRYQPPRGQEVLEVGPVAIDRMAMTVRVNGRDVPLTITEFRLLEHLARHPGRVQSRERLLAVLWRGAGNITPRAIDVYVRRVRAKIESDPENPMLLTTVRGTGYRLSAT